MDWVSFITAIIAIILVIILAIYVFTRTTPATSLPLQNTGDLLTISNSALAALPVGTNGQVLTADSTSPYGLSWTASGGGGKLAFVAQNAGTASPITEFGLTVTVGWNVTYSVPYPLPSSIWNAANGTLTVGQGLYVCTASVSTFLNGTINGTGNGLGLNLQPATGPLATLALTLVPASTTMVLATIFYIPPGGGGQLFLTLGSQSTSMTLTTSSIWSVYQLM